MKKGIEAWKAMVAFWWRYFAVGVHLRTLLKPWHREVISKDEKEFSLLERIVFSLLTRFIGLLFRLPLILLGLVFMIGQTLQLPLYLLLPIKVNDRWLHRFAPLGTSLAYGLAPHLERYARYMGDAPEKIVVGREEVFEQIERILARETQDNVLLVGDPGVGRTTVLESFARRLKRGNTLPEIRYRRVYELKVEGLTEGELRELLNEAQEAGNIILVVEDFHAYPSLLSIIAPYLEASEFQVIGVTDFTGFHGSLKDRSDIMRLFEKIEIPEPGSESVFETLREHARIHSLDVDDETLRTVVRLSDSFMHNEPQPEKSLDLLEELAVLGKKITTADVEKIVNQKTGVPVGQVREGEREKLLNLEAYMSEHIIGQEEAVKSISEAMRRARAGLKKAGKPIGSFLFFGPTGVGKTHTAKTLAEVYFGAPDRMIRFDMSEFTAPPSLPSFTERLTIATEENPFSLILFDEVEKASREILDLFLQILDEGILTDNRGRRAYFDNAIIICTSNAGSDVLQANPVLPKETLIDDLIQAQVFRPEFLNRFDGLVMFRPLSEEQAGLILELMLRRFTLELKARKGITVSFEPGVEDLLAKRAYSSTFGARAISRELQNTVENYVATKLLENPNEVHIIIPKSIFEAKA